MRWANALFCRNSSSALSSTTAPASFTAPNPRMAAASSEALVLRCATVNGFWSSVVDMLHQLLQSTLIVRRARALLHRKVQDARKLASRRLPVACLQAVVVANLRIKELDAVEGQVQFELLHVVSFDGAWPVASQKAACDVHAGAHESAHGAASFQ